MTFHLSPEQQQLVGQAMQAGLFQSEWRCGYGNWDLTAEIGSASGLTACHCSRTMVSRVACLG